MQDRIERLKRLGGTPDRRRAIDALAQANAAQERLGALLDAVMRGEALAHTWDAYRELRESRDQTDRVVTELEVIAAMMLPTAGNAVN